jgi:hypothetical protein
MKNQIIKVILACILFFILLFIILKWLFTKREGATSTITIDLAAYRGNNGTSVTDTNNLYNVYETYYNDANANVKSQIDAIGIMVSVSDTNLSPKLDQNIYVPDMPSFEAYCGRLIQATEEFGTNYYVFNPLDGDFRYENMWNKNLTGCLITNQADWFDYCGISEQSSMSHFIEYCSAAMGRCEKIDFYDTWWAYPIILFIFPIGLMWNCVDGCNEYTTIQDRTGKTVSSIGNNGNIFLFNSLGNAQTYVTVNNPIGIVSYGGSTYYYTPASNGIALQDFIYPYASADNRDIGQNVATLKPSYDDAVSSCNTTESTLNTFINNFNPANNNNNKNTYTNALKNIRSCAGITSSPTVPNGNSVSFASPNTIPYFEPAIYSIDKLNNAQNLCEDLTQIIKDETTDCCDNPNTITTPSYAKCIDSTASFSANNVTYGCNPKTQITLENCPSINPGDSSTSQNASNITSSSKFDGTGKFIYNPTINSPSPSPSPSPNNQEGFETIGQATTQLNDAANLQLNILTNIQEKTNSPAGQDAITNYYENGYSSASYTDLNTNLINVQNTLNNYKITDGGIGQDASVVQSNITDDYIWTAESINNCNNPNSIVGLDSSGNNFLTTSSPSCGKYNTAYENAKNLCQHGLNLTDQFGVQDTKGGKELESLVLDIDNGIVGQTLEDAYTILTRTTETCNAWVNMYDEWLNDEERAAAIPCKPARSTTNNFDNDATNIVNNWTIESSKYLAQLKAKLQAIEAYVSQYPNDFTLNVTHVPNETPNTPFVYMTANSMGTTGPIDYSVNVYIPAGPQGATGPPGIDGSDGANGEPGYAGKQGPAGIGEVPNQYLPYDG